MMLVSTLVYLLLQDKSHCLFNDDSLSFIQVQSLLLAPINLKIPQLILRVEKWKRPSMLVKPMKI
jgi:hypothetical protein